MEEVCFDDILLQYEPMVSAVMRRLHIYRDFETFRSVGHFAIFQAWQRFDQSKGNFTPFVYRSIHGAMLDELKRESRYSEHVSQAETETIEQLAGWADEEQYEELYSVIQQLSEQEQRLIALLFAEQRTQADCAAAFGISVAGLKKRRQKVLLKMKMLLSEEDR